MAKRKFYMVLKPDGSEAAGSELLDTSLYEEAERVSGSIVDTDGNIHYIAESLVEASMAEPADPDDLALENSTSEAAESEGTGTDG
jgi:hypothetical protein